MVLFADVLAGAHVVVEIFQFILRVNVVCQDWVIQVFKKVPADDGVFEVNIVAVSPFSEVERDIAALIKGVETDRQLIKAWEILSEDIWIFFQQLAVAPVAALKLIPVRFVKSGGKDGKDLITKITLAVQL